MSDAQVAPQSVPQPTPPQAPVLLHTPKGTPNTINPQTGAPSTLPPELVPLFTAAINSLPPGVGKTLLKQYWGYVVALLVPLLLSTWTNVKQIWEGPAQLTEIKADYEADHKKLEALSGDLEALQKQSEEDHKKINEQLERILWSIGPRAPLPASQPIPR